jgi:phosphotransferase system  glucose/maltose/N-acetylglucosamine-specific IIC component
MRETLQGLAGLALIVGLFVAYALERRARRRAAEPPPVVAEPEPPPAEIIDGTQPAPVSYGSPNWGAPIVFVLLLVGAATHRGSWWGVLWQVIYFGIIAVAAYSTFSRKELREEQERRPGTTRRDVFLRIGVPYLLIPLIAWLITMPLGITLGTLVPALPWMLLALLGVVATLRAPAR